MGSAFADKVPAIGSRHKHFLSPSTTVCAFLSLFALLHLSLPLVYSATMPSSPNSIFRAFDSLPSDADVDMKSSNSEPSSPEPSSPVPLRPFSSQSILQAFSSFIEEQSSDSDVSFMNVDSPVSSPSTNPPPQLPGARLPSIDLSQLQSSVGSSVPFLSLFWSHSSSVRLSSVPPRQGSGTPKSVQRVSFSYASWFKEDSRTSTPIPSFMQLLKENSRSSSLPPSSAPMSRESTSSDDSSSTHGSQPLSRYSSSGSEDDYIPELPEPATRPTRTPSPIDRNDDDQMPQPPSRRELYGNLSLFNPFTRAHTFLAKCLCSPIFWQPAVEAIESLRADV